jgi:acyl-CoA dehydrogenase
MHVLRQAFAADLMNCDIPTRYGGRGLGLLESILLTEGLAAACSGIATSIFDNTLGYQPLLLSENEPARATYLPSLAREFRLICFATSEPTMGSDVAGLRCRAELQEDRYVLNGTKFWVTNGALADLMTVFATVDPESKHAGICAFLVERTWEGVEIGSPIPKLGQRTSNTTALHLRNVRVPRQNVLAEPGDGFVLAMKSFARTRPAIGALAVGAARTAMELAIDYAKKRRAFGTKLANFQAIQFKIAEMFQKVETARLLVWKSAWEADQGLDNNISAAIAKLYATEAAYEIVDQALQVLGGFGYTRFFPLEKLLRDTRLLRIYEGSSEIQRIVVSAHVLDAYQPVLPSLEYLPMLRGLGSAGLAGETPAWRCRACGHTHRSPTPPPACPVCFLPGGSFTRVWPPQVGG